MENKSNPLLIRLVELIDENLQNEQFGVSELADGIGMSRSNLHRKLQELTGQSISQFIREHRLNKARSILEKENVTASEVAYRVGFSSPSYFSKSYNELFGFPPGATRMRMTGILNEAETNVPQKKKSRIYAYSVIGLLSVLLVVWYFTGNSNSDVIYTDKSIAVLPFRNQSSDVENQYFADGVMDAIRTSLLEIRDLRVTSRTSTERFRDIQDKSISEIANELNVAYILEGSAQKYGDNIQITAQLIHAETDRNIWSENYTGTFEDVISLQNEIAEGIANSLKAVLSESEKKALNTPPTIHPEAYDNYLLAEYQFNKWNKESFVQAVNYYEKAISFDPKFVDAYVGLGTIYEIGGSVWGIYPQQEAYSRSISYLKKALDLDPGHAIARATMGSVLFYYEWDFDSAATQYHKFEEIRGYKNEFELDYLIKTNRHELALSAADVLIDRDPLRSAPYVFKAEAHFFLGDTLAAEKTFDQAVSLFDDLFILREAAKNYYMYGRYDKSRQLLKKHLQYYKDRPPIINFLLASFAARDEASPDEFIEMLKTQFINGESGSPAWFLAMFYAEQGEQDQLFEWLERSYVNHEVEMTWLNLEPLLNPYINDPRYLKLREQMNIPG